MQRATVARWTWGWLSSGQQVRTDESKHSCWLLVVLNRRQVNETRVFPCFRKCTFDVKQEIEEDEGREMCRRTKRTMYTCDCVVLSYDSYLLTTEKPFLLFRRVSSVLSFLPLLLSLLLARLCVSSFIFSCERERKRTSIVRLLARICCCLSFSLSPCASLLHPLLLRLDATTTVHRLLLLIIVVHIFLCFEAEFFH